ncbi:ABC transporter permease [Salinivirga cyanobacteriivorans]|uniref:Glycine betaine transport system permease protein OpuAB n=1 Tax=Salinivirga cyanobacteriivorans TaxID=1307839 RepID=A0A0S2HVS9_9BACT|nr:proline/glycine betaine ABC transporter permease [Salinivirga cyanobacteriivorans]ALO14152.1 Glycine betaine transport system permease protein OpuAB [Salinivirga cyanobacteriivorans]
MKIELGKYIEQGVDWLSANAGGFFDAITAGVDAVVTAMQFVLLNSPFWLTIIILALLSYYLPARGKLFTKAGWKAGGGMLIFTVLGLLLLYFMGYWEETMLTIALILASALIALIIGIPLGIYAARNDGAEKIIRPILDFMQTMPAFVYLIPAIILFSVGNVPGVVATIIFALPPAVRLTNLGIRNVPEDVVEASKAFGSTKRQLLFKVQLPLAMTTILAGVNQVIMLSLSMVVIASMVGAGGLGQAVYKGILKADIGLGFEAGVGIVVLAIILDRITQNLGFGPSKPKE